MGSSSKRKDAKRVAEKPAIPAVIIPIMFSPEALDVVFWALSKQERATVAPIIAGITEQVNMFNILNREKAEAGQAA